MRTILTTAALSVLLTACGGSENGLGLDEDNNTPTLGAAQAATSPDTTEAAEVATVTAAVAPNTSDLVVDAEFDFASSRSIAVNFDIADAQGTDASVSICTDYGSGGDAFDVNYDSCTVNAEMRNGQFNHVMEVTHEFDAVVAVVWFQDPGTAPLYKEFFVNEAVPENRSKDARPMLVWR